MAPAAFSGVSAAMTAPALMATLAAFVGLFALLLAAAVGDIRRRSVSNRLVAAIIVLWVLWRGALLAAALAGGAGVMPVLAGSLEAVVSAAIIGGGMLLFTTAYERVRGDFAFGGGDIKLLAAVALFLGVTPTLFVLGASCAVSLVFAAANRCGTAQRGIPFATCLACGLPLGLLVLL